MPTDAPVLVCTDFSPASRRALEVANEICARVPAPLVVVHVWNVNHLAGGGRIVPQLESWICEQKDHLGEELERWTSDIVQPGIEVSTRVLEGVASRAIPELIRAVNAQLVVVGRRGSANLSHVLLGSVSERLVHQSIRPVLVVPEHSAAAPRPRKLLVGIDFSESSRDAYDFALGLAQAMAVPQGLHLLHVQPSLQDIWGSQGDDLSYPGEYPYDLRSLERWAGVRSDHAVPIAASVAEGRTEEVLLHFAESEGCDWLVLGREGRTGLAAFLMGSTADRTLKRADRPVLVVPGTSSVGGDSAG